MLDEESSEDSYLYTRLAELIRNQIFSEQLKGRVPGIRQLARQYSINFKTANKAISTLVSEGLLYRRQGKGTFVVDSTNRAAELITIGLILPDIVNPYFAKLAQSLQRMALTREMAILVNTSYSDPDNLARTLKLYRTRGVRAIIVQGGVVHNEKSLKAIMNSNIPIIGTHAHLPGIDDVRPDVQAGAQIATEHLLERFGPDVAYICGSDEPIMKTGRFFGFRDALLSKGYRVDLRYLRKAPPTYKGGYEAAMQILKKDRKPRSIFVYNQIMAMGVVSAIKHLGFEVPVDVAVAGCDDSVDEREMLVPTTSVSFSFEETANLLLSLVERRLRNPGAEAETYRVAPKLVVRESTSEPLGTARVDAKRRD